MPLAIKKSSGYADIVELNPKNWQYTIGFIAGERKHIIYERRSDLKSKHNATEAMEAAFQRMEKFVQENNFWYLEG